MLDILIYSPDLARTEYGETHPFKPMRAKLFVELLNRFYLIFEDNQRIVEPVPINEELLCLFHDRQYVEVLKKASAGEFSMEMLWAEIGTGDNPIFKGMFEFVLNVAGATLPGSPDAPGRWGEDGVQSRGRTSSRRQGSCFRLLLCQ